MRHLLIFFSLITLFSCRETKKEASTSENTSEHIRYAKGFNIEYHENYKIVKVLQPWKGENKSINYVLYDNEKPENIEGIFIKTPIKSIVCLSLTHLAFIEKLNEVNSIKGIAGCNYVSSEAIKEKINANIIQEVGQHEVFNYEILVNIAPDIVMAYGIDQSSTAKLNKFASLGLTTVLNAEYMELHPLGMAEWIKFAAAFYNKEQLADSIFKHIETEYLSVKKTVADSKEQPTVFTGMPWNGAWHVPGGASFQAQFLKDAGANYIWSDNDEERSIVKSKEIIIDEALDADFWLNVNAFNSLAEIIAQDAVLANFAAVKNQQVYNNNLKVNAAMGNDYWESGVVNPHIILKDLIAIFHPTKIEHQLYYYKRLEN
ncbi:MAG: ABC transporter substrate-binding protein [Flavobacteriales bacterium]|jgi:cobalamin transport system substrate-binding protein|nr:ABC transporter substrate-binding protein [Flavobacteriales bacterium]|tara:strand:- start:39434 stop:40555 length:1122 start_codon:yes stop_codon:yes gene_type:complete